MARPRKPLPPPERTRRRRGTGSVHYSARLACWVATPPASVDPKRRPVYGFETKDAAESWLADQLDPTRRRYGDVHGGMLLGAWLERWYETTTLGLALQSKPVYLDAIRVAEPLHAIPLEQLSPTDCRAWATAVRSRYASRTATQRIGIIKTAVKAAVLDRLIPSNPFDALPVSRARKQRIIPKPHTVWSRKQVDKFLRHVRNDPLEAFWWLALTIGARLAELRALTWADIDWQAGTVAIGRGVTQVGQHVTDETKTGPHRLVELPAATLAALKRHHARQQPLSAWCFPTTQKRGGPWSGESIRWRFTKLTKEAELPPMTAYNCRHTAITLMLAPPNPMAPSDVAAIVGHASPALTLRVYSQSIASNRSLVRQKMEALFPAAEEPPEQGFQVENG